MLTQEDYDVLKKASRATLLRWGHTLNDWKWPKDLPNPEPTWKLGVQDEEWENARGRAIIKWISGRVSQYDELRYHNVIVGRHPHRMTEEEFEDWWHGLHEGDQDAYERDFARNTAKYEDRAAVAELRKSDIMHRQKQYPHWTLEKQALKED